MTLTAWTPLSIVITVYCVVNKSTAFFNGSGRHPLMSRRDIIPPMKTVAAENEFLQQEVRESLIFLSPHFCLL